MHLNKKRINISKIFLRKIDRCFVWYIAFYNMMQDASVYTVYYHNCLECIFKVWFWHLAFLVQMSYVISLTTIAFYVTNFIHSDTNCVVRKTNSNIYLEISIFHLIHNFPKFHNMRLLLLQCCRFFRFNYQIQLLRLIIPYILLYNISKTICVCWEVNIIQTYPFKKRNNKYS